MAYYRFLFEQLGDEQKDILIAWLSNAGFTGFEEDENVLMAYISKADFDNIAFEETISALAVKYNRSELEETNWNAQWESGFEPVDIMYPSTTKPFVHIRAGFHKPFHAADHDIVITPKMSFGTGHHATTYLVAEQMSRIGFKGKSVIDFGTGTGVLAILAERLGAAKVIAIDLDDWSIANATENIKTNHCEFITVLQGDTIPAGQKADVILANINLNIITANLDAIKNACKKDTVVVFSGVMEHDKSKLLEALENNHFIVVDILHRNGWLAVIAGI